MRIQKITKLAALLAAIGVVAGTTSAWASVTFTASGTGVGGDALEGTATFQTLAGNQLQITLANSSTGDAHTTANLLTALFFNGATGLTPVSATVPAGQLEWNSGVSTTLGSALNVGTQWEYASPGGAPNGATAGVSSAGLGLFGQGNFAPSGANLDGAPYGLVPLGFMTTGGSHDGLINGQSNPTFENTVILVLSGWTGSDSDIANVSFQYGTTLADSNLTPTPVPEVSTILASMLLLLPFGASTLRILRRNRIG